MLLSIVRADITKLHVDAIVNPTDAYYSGSGGTDLQVHFAAGPGLREDCMRLPRLHPGEVSFTYGHNLPCRGVIHTHGPLWQGGDMGEDELLRACYRNALRLAEGIGLKTLAFPIISAGTFGYPKDRALSIATETIKEHLLESDMQVILAVQNMEIFQLSENLYSDVSHYIESCFLPSAEASAFDAAFSSGPDEWGFESCGALPFDDIPSFSAGNTSPRPAQCRPAAAMPAKKPAPRLPFLPNISAPKHTPKEEPKEAPKSKPIEAPKEPPKPAPSPARESHTFSSTDSFKLSPPEHTGSFEAFNYPMFDAGDFSLSLEDELKAIDESFSQMLLRKIDELGMKDSECYKRANIDKRVFSKIRSNPAYRPSKPTVLAFAVALRLDIEETKELLMKAGFALSKSSKFDIIVEYFIKNRLYDIYEINNVLFKFDQSLLGSM